MKIIIVLLFLVSQSTSYLVFENPRLHLSVNQRKSINIVQDFKFKNTSGKRILEVNTSCTCTSPFFTKDYINPNETGIIRLSTTSDQLKMAGKVDGVVKIDTKEKQFYKIVLYYE